MTDTAEELRIVAKDNARSGRLSVIDRATIEQAADELDEAMRQLRATHQALVEARQHGDAMNERIAEFQRKRTFPTIAADNLNCRFLPVNTIHWYFQPCPP